MIGRILREIIKKRKLTYRKIASDLSMDHGNLYHSLKNGANPEWKTIEKLLDYLGYDFRLVKRKGGKWNMISTTRKPFEEIGIEIHKNLQKLFQKCKGEILTAGEVKKRYEREFKKPDVKWVQASDHVINPTHKKDWHCWCVGTDEAIFEKIKYGTYKVR